MRRASPSLLHGNDTHVRGKHDATTQLSIGKAFIFSSAVAYAPSAVPQPRAYLLGEGTRPGPRLQLPLQVLS